MSINVLNEEYYHDKYGIYTDKHVVIGNCVTRCLFFTLKNELMSYDKKKINYLYMAFLENLTPCVRIDSLERVVGFSLNYANYAINDLVEIEQDIELKGCGKKAIENMTAIIKQNKSIIIGSNANYLRFHKNHHFDTDDTITQQRIIHFLGLKIQDNQLYYVYNHTLCDKNNFVPYPHNPSVGIQSLDDFEKAFDSYFHGIVVSPKYAGLEQEAICIHLLSTLKQSCLDYYSTDKTFGILSGRQGLDFLIKKINSQEFYMDTTFPSFHPETNSEQTEELLCEQIRKTVSWLCWRRTQYIYLIHQLNISNNEVIKDFINYLQKSIQNWTKFKDYHSYQYMKSNYLFHKNYINFISDIIHSEDALFHYLANNLEHIQEIFMAPSM